MGDPIPRKSSSNRLPKIQFKQVTKRPNYSGGREHAGKRGNKKSKPLSQSNSKQHLSKGEKRGNHETHYRPKTGQQLHSLSEVQNGIPKKPKKSAAKRRLHGKNRFKGCILHRALKSRIQKIRKIFVGRRGVRIPLPDVRARPSPQDIYEANENSHFNAEEIENSSDNLHGRHAYHGQLSGGNCMGKGHNPSPLRGPGVCDKLQEVHPEPSTVHRILRDDSGQHKNVPDNSNREGGKSNEFVFQNAEIAKGHPQENGKNHRETEINSTSLLLGPTADETSPTGVDTRNQEETLLRGFSVPIGESHSRTAVVDRKSEAAQRETHLSESPRSVDLHGRGQGEEWRLGSRMPRLSNGGAMEQTGESSSYQHFGVNGCRDRLENLSEGETESLSPFTDRQHGGAELPEENGGHQQHCDDRYHQKDLVLSPQEGDISLSGIYSLRAEYCSRLGIKELGGLQRMESEPISIQENLQPLGGTGNRPFCLSNLPQNEEVHELETRPYECGDRRFHSELEQYVPLCLPTLLPNWQNAQESTETSDSDDNYHPSVGNPTLVPTSIGNVCQGSIAITKSEISPGKSQREGTPPHREQLIETGSLVGFGESGKTTTISSTATSLIENSRTAGTRKNYRSAWGKFSSWCRSRKIDPVSCPLNYVLDYLGSLYDDKREYSCMNNHRSALSAYHDPIEGFSVGKHPLVRNLMKGASNLRPPQPRYRHIWDVEIVIQKMRDMPHNSSLTLKQLSYKLITLLGLCAIKRSGELAALNVKWMSVFSDKTECAFGIRGKTSGSGQVAKPIAFHRFADNDKICPAKCLENYIDRTSKYRLENSTHLVFLSVNKPHKPVTRPTLTKWILKMLNSAGVNTQKFNAHSLRSASSSKVANLGLKLVDILENGNWTNESTWQRFYHKRVASASQRFQETLLTGRPS